MVGTVSKYAGMAFAGNDTGSVVFVDEQPGDRLASLSARSETVAVAISPNGKLLATSGFDSLSLWELPSGRLLAGNLSLGTAPRFVGDDRVVTFGTDGNLNLINLNPGALISSACTIAARNLTRQEFTDYLGGEAYHKTCPQWPAAS